MMSCICAARRVCRVSLALLVLCACESQDARDQRAVRRLCALPPDATVVSWSGYPAEVGFGQREGLSIEAEFAMPGRFALAAAGYRQPPWPAAREAAERSFRLGGMIDGARAIRCETAGNDVLNATATVACDTVPRPLDLVLCVVDAKSGHVRAAVRAAY